MAVVQTSFCATIPDASQNDLSVILMMIVVTIQMNTLTVRNQLAVQMSLLATTNAVFSRSGNVMEITIVVT